MRHQLLEIFQDDDVTLLTSCSTDPAHDRPYLKPVPPGVESEVDLVQGRGVIGQLNVELVDMPTSATDQTTGWFTALLANESGHSRLVGRRARVRQQDVKGEYYTIFDGVISDIDLLSNIVTYRIILKDFRERERQARAFVSAAIQENGITVAAPAVLPRGTLHDYGIYSTYPNKAGLSPAVAPLKGRYRAIHGRIEWVGTSTEFGWEPDNLKIYQVATQQMLEAGASHPLYGDNQEFLGYAFTNVAILWRPSSGGSWTEVRNPSAEFGTFQTFDNIFMTRRGRYKGQEVTGIAAVYLMHDNKDLLPSNNQLIDFIVIYVGAPTKDYPLLLTDRAGQILKNLYDGVYSTTNPRIPYNADAMADYINSTPIIHVPITEVLEGEQGIRKFTEEHLYKPWGAAPAIGSNFEIVPIRYELPDAEEELLELNDTNSRLDADWHHEGTSAKNVVEFRYKIDRLLDPSEDDPLGIRARGYGVQEQTGVIKFIHAESVAVLGERPVVYEPITVRSIEGANPGDRWVSADRLARQRRNQIFDRYSHGAQWLRIRARADDEGVAAAQVGDWCIGGWSWLPEYTTGKRGMNRLLQIVRINPIDPLWRELVVEDAGPAHQPIGQPTLGTLSVGDDGVVSIPVTAIPTGGEAAVYAALSPTAPDPKSGLWVLVGRVDATGTLYTDAYPEGSLVWVQARGEAEGRRPSAFTNPVSIQIPQTPRLHQVELTLMQDGAVRVEWQGGAFTKGVRLAFGHHDPDDEPEELPDSVDVDADEGFYEWPAETVPVAKTFTVEVQPWSGFSDGEVAGTMGPVVRRSVDRTGFPTLTSFSVFFNEKNNTLRLRASTDMSTQSVRFTYLREEEEDDEEEEEVVSVDVQVDPETNQAIYIVEEPTPGVYLCTAQPFSSWDEDGEECAGVAGSIYRMEAATDATAYVAPVFRFETLQSENSGGVRVEITDPQNRVKNSAYKLYDPNNKASSLDFTGPPTGWTTPIVEYPGYMVVSLRGKHHSMIAIAFLVEQADGEDRWVIYGPWAFDTGHEANVWDIGASWTASGQLVVRVFCDTDTVGGYLTVGVGSSPSDPTAASNHGSWTGQQASISTGLSVPYGADVYIKARGYNAAGAIGPVKEMQFTRGDAKYVRPHIAVTAVRSGDNVTVTLTIKDPTLAVTLIQRQYKDGGGSLSSLATWTGGTGTPGSHTTLQRTHVLNSPPGLDAQFVWAVEYTDENGATQRIGDTIDISNLKEETAEIDFSASIFVPGHWMYQWEFHNQTLRLGQTSDNAVFYAPITVPRHVVLTWITVRRIRSSPNEAATFHFYRYNADGSINARLDAFDEPGPTGAWETAGQSLNEPVGEDYSYGCLAILVPDASTTTPAIGKISLEYDRGAYAYTY